MYRAYVVAWLLLLEGLGGCELPLEDMEPDESDVVQSIVGGAPATEGEYPFMGFLQISGPGGSFSCAGTLVRPALVLTAAHCVFDTSRIGAVSQPADVTVTLGRTRRSDTSRGEVIAVSEVIRHPWYSAASSQNDVALLRLSRASIQPTIEIAPPYGPSDRILWAAGVNATIIGWGRTSYGGVGSDALLEAQVPILDDALPGQSDWYGSAFDPTTMVAAGYALGGIDTCQGDSGGPLLVPSRNGWKQVGITSWGYGCAWAKRPGVYTRISALRIHRWIKSIIHETPHVGDVNGDSMDDIVTFTHGDPAYGPLDVWVALSNGTGFGSASLWAGWWAHRHHIPMLGDFNGDNRDDIFAFTEVGDVWVALSRGYDFNGTVYQSPIIMDIDDVPMVGDVNGDGRDDIVIFNADHTMDTYVVLSTGSGFGPKTKWHDSFGLTGETFAVADVNGDGLEDILTFNQGVNGNNVWVALSTGWSFAPSSVWHPFFGTAEEMPGVGDFNADGCSDIVTFTRDANADVYVGLSNCTNGFTVSLWNTDFGGPRGTYRTGNVNGGVGRADIIRFTQDDAADVFVRLSTGSGFGAQSLWHAFFAP